jgi:hypothetical protein
MHILKVLLLPAVVCVFLLLLLLIVLQVQFSSPHIFCDIAIEGVSNTQNGEPVKYGTKSGLSTASYQVV